MRHTCGTAESGSERSENTCAACHDDQARWQRKRPPDFSWLYENCTPRTELSAREHEAQRASPKTKRGT